MYKKSLNLLLGMTLVLGVYLMLVGETWFSVWLGLEINLMSFLPLVVLSPSLPSSAGLKYFLIQAVASLLLLQASFSSVLISYSYMIILLALSLKLGLAPFHFWLPLVAESISWGMNMVLFTVQKFGPFFLLSSLSSLAPKVCLMLGVISSFVGALGGLNELLFRKLMAYSSISHMGWILVAMLVSSSLWGFYIFIYIVVSLSLMMYLKKYNVFHLSQTVFKIKSFSPIFVMFLSLGGFPPFLGFVGKWAVLVAGVNLSLLVVLLLVLTSVVTLFFYIRSGLMMLTLSAKFSKSSFSFSSGILGNMLVLFNVLGGFVYMYLWSSFML